MEDTRSLTEKEWTRYLHKKVALLFDVPEEALMVRKHDIEPTKKTEGGPVKPQGEYKVGEKGEEVFIPIPKTVRGDAVPEKKG